MGLLRGRGRMGDCLRDWGGGGWWGGWWEGVGAGAGRARGEGVLSERS